MHISLLKYLNLHNVRGSYCIVGVQNLFSDLHEIQHLLLNVVHAGLCPQAVLFSCASGVLICFMFIGDVQLSLHLLFARISDTFLPL